MEKNDGVRAQLQPGGIELLADFDHISIPVDKLVGFIRAETERNILRRAYMTLDSYRLEDIMCAIFGPGPEGAKKNAE